MKNKRTFLFIPSRCSDVQSKGKRRSLCIFLFQAVLLLSMSSCSLSPRAQPVDLPASALETALEGAGADPLMEITDWMPDEWWKLFGDDQLTQFIQMAFARNPSLQIAQANILGAKFAAERVRSTLFPTLNWGADVSRQKFSETGIIPFNSNPTPGMVPLAATGGVDRIPVYFTQYETEFILNYEFDIWGKNRNNLKSALGEMRARIADEAFYRLHLGILVARVYLQLQIDYERQKIAQALVDNQSKYLNYIQWRTKGNLDNRLLVHTSKTNVSTARETLLQVQKDIAVNECQLKAYLAGNFEENIDDRLIAQQSLPKVPLPVDLPLHLIAHRPDVIAQLWLIESAGKQIELAKGGFYPDFNLFALFGYQTLHLQKLFEWRSSDFNIDPAVTLPIFEGGRLVANLNTSRVNYDLAIFRYNNLVLNAVREVLDGITVLSNTEKQLKEFKAKAREQEALLQLTRLRMRYSLNSGLDELVSEQNLLSARDQEMVALGNTLQAILSLIKALGGGYTACVEGD